MAEPQKRELDPSESPPPQAKNQSLGSAVSSYEKCSLCNNIIRSEAQHMAREHPHVQHIDDLLERPIPPPPPRESLDAAAREIGSFVIATSIKSDLGESAFGVLQRAQAQLSCLLEQMGYENRHVYLFGSSVSMGSWDGLSDGDFSFASSDGCNVLMSNDRIVTQKEEAENPDGNEGVVVESDEDDSSEKRFSSEEPKVIPLASDDTVSHMDLNEIERALMEANPFKEEKRMICNIAARLRSAGFLFRELEPVLHTRIPILRRKQVRQWRPVHFTSKTAAISFHFNSNLAEREFREHQLEEYISTYNAKRMPSANSHKIPKLVLHVPDSTDAIHLMSRHERIRGVRKEWHGHQRNAEIFSIDFDISCRHHGIRNSWLLRRYLKQNEVFRLGYVFLKMWSKACGVNNPRIGFLTSYAIAVLWIYFLLHRNEVVFVDPADIPVLPNPETQTTVPYIPLWPPLADDEADANRVARLGHLLRCFFYFYGEYFDWDTHVVTIRQSISSGSGSSGNGSAKPLMKKDLGWETSNTSSLLLRDRCYHILSIEDVYEDNLDLGRHLTPEKAAWTRLQFRLAYQRCCLAARTREAGAESPLWLLLDTPHHRAKDVLHTRLYRYLLCNTEDAAASASEIVENLGVRGESETECAEEEEEDPMYLFCAYELRSRLCDLWFDHYQILEDTELHLKHDRRKEDYTPPTNPIQKGDWAAVCTDDLHVDDDPSVAYHHRTVRLVPPVNCEEPASPKGVSVRTRTVQLIKSRREYDRYAQMFGAHMMSQRYSIPAVAAGVLLSKTIRGTLIPHCFYSLRGHRVFGTHAARVTFTRCVKDVIWALKRLYDSNASSPLGKKSDPLPHHEKLLNHLKVQLHATTIFSSPAYQEVLKLLCQSLEMYISPSADAYKHGKLNQLRPTPLLLSLADDG